MQGRHYGMDWLRIAAFGLLILYHVGMAFVPWPYEVKLADPPIGWTTIPMMASNPWRLSLLFVVSGYASAAMLARGAGPGAFLRARAVRLGLPLLFGILVVVTPQPWIALVTQHGYAHGFGHFLLHDYYRFQFIDGIAMPTWMHLWFVLYLLAYTMVLAGLMGLPAGWRSAGRRLAERALAGPGLLLLPIAWVWLARGTLGWLDTHAFFDDWGAHAVYLPMLLFGVLLRRSEVIQAQVARLWRLAAALAILSWLYMAGCELGWPGDARLPRAMGVLFHAARATMGWTAIVALIGLADRYWNRDGRWRATLAEAVFPFYLVHQTIILVAGWWLLGTDTGPLARFVLLVAATAAGCWAFYLAGREIGWVRLLIGLRRRPAAAPATAARPAAG